MPSNSDLVINEFMASNDSTAADQDGEYEDWIELYNNTDANIDLTGYYLSDDATDLTQWAFPDGTTIAANGYLMVWADGDEDQEGLHANFKLSSSGESIYLVDATNEIVDVISYEDQTTDVSYGRFPNGTGDFQEMNPTFNAENNSTTVDPCVNAGGDADNDGICADEDCDDNDESIGAKKTVGTTCDDGDVNTENDVIMEDGCTCAGTTIDLCADAGEDADNDGICADEDCDDTDASIGAKQTAGTTCNDGDVTTENDVIMEDGCTCTGTTMMNAECSAPTDFVVAGLGERRIQISWPAVQNAVNYTIQIRFKGQTNWVVTTSVRLTKVNLYGPLIDYEYRVQSNCADGESEYSSIDEFSIPTNNLTTVAESRSNENTLQEILIPEPAILYPNPAMNNLNLIYPTVSKQTTFVIYNMVGKEVYRQQMVVDTETYSFAIDHLETGLYLGVVQENGQVNYTEQFVKQ